jgi:hypothetical protein
MSTSISALLKYILINNQHHTHMQYVILTNGQDKNAPDDGHIRLKHVVTEGRTRQ